MVCIELLMNGETRLPIPALTMYRLAVVRIRSRYLSSNPGRGIRDGDLPRSLGAVQFKMGEVAGMKFTEPFRNAGIAAGLALGMASTAMAVSCTTQSQLNEADREPIANSAKALAGLVQSGNSAGLKASTIASVAERFDPIAAAVESASPLIQRATITVDALYVLDSSDAKTVEEETQFFCGGANSHEVVLTIPRIPAGKYAVAVLHATGVDSPQSITFILSREDMAANPWKLAGAFIHPLTSAGHDGVWYWTKAREFARKKQNWNAYFYYQTAASLLTPVYFFSSPNLDKLLKEQAAIAPNGLPGANQPMLLSSAGGQSFEIQDMHTDSSLGGLDLVVEYKAQDTSDPVASRTRNLELMKAILTQHPEVRDGFHGLWAFANAANEQPFANELPMGQIQ